MLLACDFLGTVTLTGARMYVLAVIEHYTRRRIRVLGATGHPDHSVGDPSGAEPGHGSGGRRLPGTVPDPRPGRQVP
ncbi:hypothetical protein GCM10009727_13490 [Actinomadura napierensis]|uniref:Uncharacterized protein n=1 Tax=Actinomadura napierensis TaxID=267854 RepID=A0ABN2YD60_9ACTN